MNGKTAHPSAAEALLLFTVKLLTKVAESRRDYQEEGGELDFHEEVRHFCGSRRDQEERGGAGLTS